MQSHHEINRALSSQNNPFVQQYAYLFLTDVIEILSGIRGYSSYEHKEPGYARALFQAYQCAFTTDIQNGNLSHAILKEIHHKAMSHQEMPAGHYRIKGGNLSIATASQVFNPSVTEQGFNEFVEKWLIKPKQSIHFIHFKSISLEDNRCFLSASQEAALVGQESKDKKLELVLFGIQGKGYLTSTLLINGVVAKQEKSLINEQEYSVLVSQLKHPSTECFVNIGDDESLSICGYPDIQTAFVEKLDEIFNSYNSRIPKASSQEEKLALIVETAQLISQLHPFMDGNVRTCKVLMDRLMYQHGLSFSLLIDPNRFDCFDLESLIDCVKEGQVAFLSLLQAKVPHYEDPRSGVNLQRAYPLPPYDLPDLEKEITTFLQLITAPTPRIMHTNTLRPIVILAPGETARLSAAKAAETDLLILLKTDRRAIVLKDKLGTISVTHVDQNSSLGFVKTEQKWLKTKCSLDIIKHADEHADFSQDPIYLNIRSELGCIVKNSKNSDDLRSTKTGAVLIKKGRLCTPTAEQVEQVLALKVGCVVPSGNPLKGSQIMESLKPYQVRVFERFFLQLATQELLPPVLVYADGWTNSYPRLPARVSEFCEQAYKSRMNQEALAELISTQALAVRSTAELNTPYAQALLGRYPYFFRNYWDCLAKNRALQVSGFFSEKQTPSRAIELIMEYAADSQEEAANTLVV